MQIPANYVQLEVTSLTLLVYSDMERKMSRSNSAIDVEYRPRYLVMGPGGIRGFYMLGALSRFNREGILSSVEGYSGSSVGALISLLTVVGYQPSEICSMAADASLFTDFFSARLGEKISEIRENHGLLSTDNVRSILERAVVSRLGREPTLLELYNITGKELYLTTYNMTLGRTEYLSYRSHPSLSVVTAALLSMSIPYLFYQARLNGHLCVDGGLTDPLPIQPFVGRGTILAIYIKTTISELPTDSEIAKLTKRIQKIIQAPMAELRDRTIRGADESVKFVELGSTTLDTTGLSSSVIDRAHMYVEGWHTVNSILGAGIRDNTDTIGTSTGIHGITTRTSNNSTK